MTNPASTATTTYTVIVSLPADAPSLTNGAIGTVGIVTGTASGIALPSSAVGTTGGRHAVTVLDGSTTRDVAVQIGVVGDQWTQVTSGLTAGQQVVLATLSEPLPRSATATNNANTTVNAASRARIFFGGDAVPGRG
jgi:trimeric autotransporter adhesin